MNARARDQALSSIESEIRAEMAASLGRVGSRLKTLLSAMAELAASIPLLSGVSLQEALIRYRKLRDEARLYRWYLIVQREAIGLRNHAEVDHFYPIPSNLS
ncbi:MAG TPA: hypothetical protein VFG11_02735 [Acidobacteriota bacterium]|nr:hypothetical protein [Acidobacteriota bacterium]